MDFSDKTSKSTINHSSLAQYVILDVGIPTPANITTRVLTTIQKVLCLGSGRMSLIGVALINSIFEQVFSLSSTNSQLHKILLALKSVIDTVRFRSRISTEEFQDNIYIGVKRALEDFLSLSLKMEHQENCPTELQIMIISMKSGSETQFYTEQLLTALPTKHLTKIQVIELVHDYLEVDETNQSYSGVLRRVERLRVPGSPARLEELMKQWLVRGPSEREDVRIVLQDLVVLCDFQQCLVHPVLDTTKEHQTIHDLTECMELETDTLLLEVTHRLASYGICETQISGDPVILVPSQCYQLSWADKQVNQQYYLTIIEKLTMTKEYLVVKLEVPGQPLKYFILMPGEGFILMRTLVTAEVVMPFSRNLTFQMDQEIDNNSTKALLSVPTLMAYEPSDFPTGLYKQLVQAALHPAKDTSRGGPSGTKTLTRTPQGPLCKDPSHHPIVVGIEIKKTVKRKKLSGRKLKKNAANDLPKLSETDQKTLNDFFSQKRNK